MSLPVVLLLVASVIWFVRLQAARARARSAAASFFKSLNPEIVIFPGQVGTVGFTWRRHDVRFLLRCGAARASFRAVPPEDVELSPASFRWTWDGRQAAIRAGDGFDARQGEWANDRIRQNLERISRLAPEAGGTVTVTSREVVLRRDGGLPDDGLMPVFANLAMPVVLRVMRVCRLRGVEILETAATGEGTCPVCGCAMDAASVRCAGCRAPHHRECWDYVGACSTFGCGGTLFEGGFAAQGPRRSEGGPS
jgi:hypothetical protein